MGADLRERVKGRWRVMVMVKVKGGGLERLG